MKIVSWARTNRENRLYATVSSRTQMEIPGVTLQGGRPMITRLKRSSHRVTTRICRAAHDTAWVRELGPQEQQDWPSLTIDIDKIQTGGHSKRLRHASAVALQGGRPKMRILAGNRGRPCRPQGDRQWPPFVKEQRGMKAQPQSLAQSARPTHVPCNVLVA